MIDEWIERPGYYERTFQMPINFPVSFTTVVPVSEELQSFYYGVSVPNGNSVILFPWSVSGGDIPSNQLRIFGLGF